MMKQIISILILLFLTSCASSVQLGKHDGPHLPASPDEEQLIKAGIRAHDAGNFDEAIKLYQSVLARNEHVTWALYELSYSFASRGDLKESLDAALKGTHYDSPYLERFYLMVANNLDHLDRAEEAIQVYNQAIAEFPDDHMLHYNLGVTYARLRDLNNAKANFKNAVVLEPTHASSHLALATILQQQGNSVVALMAHSRFLILEPNSRRSDRSKQQLLSILQAGTTKDPTKPKQINITLNVNTPKDEGDFSSVELMLSLLFASKMAKEADQAKDPLPETFESLFKMMSEVSGKKKTGFGWEYYVPYFVQIQQRGFVSSFLHHIFQDKPADENAMNKFLKWSETYDWSGWPPNRSLKPTE